MNEHFIAVFELISFAFMVLVLYGAGKFRGWSERHLPSNQVPPSIVVLAVRVIAFFAALGLLAGLVDGLILKR